MRSFLVIDFVEVYIADVVAVYRYCGAINGWFNSCRRITGSSAVPSVLVRGLNVGQ